MSSTRNFYIDLPEKLQEIALSYCEDRDKVSFIKNRAPFSMLFDWKSTKEGWDFWNNVHRGEEIHKEYLINEECLFDKVFGLISKVINHGK